TFLGVAAAGFAQFFRFNGGASSLQLSFSLALIGAGHLVGISVGIAMLVGIFIAWGVATPHLSAGLPGEAADVALQVWRSQVRFIGAGTIGIAAIWSLVKLVKPVYDGMVATARAGAKADAPTEQDLSLPLIGLLSLLCLVMIGWLLFNFI